MLIQIINRKTLEKIIPPREHPCNLTIYQSGSIRLSTGLAQAMEIEDHSRIEIVHFKGETFIAKSARPEAFKLSGSAAPKIQARDLVEWLTETLDLPLDKINKVKLPVAKAPQYINGFRLHLINPE